MSNFRKHAVSRIAALAMLLFASFSALAADLTPNASPIMLTVPGSYTYGNSFSGGPIGIESFTDAYAFTISPANFNSIATTISLGNILDINNLSAALFLGNGLGGTLLSGWSSPIPIGTFGDVTVLDTMSLAAGTYTLGIMGDVTGTSGGSYSGVLNLASPVPEPSQSLALFAGLVLLGFQLKRTMRDRE